MALVPASSHSSGAAIAGAYTQRTTSLTISATSDATAEAFITSAALVGDGATRVSIFFALCHASITSGDIMVANLYDGSTDLGRIALLQGPSGVGVGALIAPLAAAFYLIPTAATHTYSIRLWKTAGTAVANAGTGGTATQLPASLWIATAA